MDLDDVVTQAIAWRRHLHAHPELSFEEHETAAFVEARLRSFGQLEIVRPTPTSVVARLRCGEGRTIALRADMDALPIDEDSGVPFSSTRPGVMHACGHDMHTAILLAVARILVERRAEMRGEVLFIFQHAEERAPGGASELVRAGVVDDVDAIVGAHVLSDVEATKVGVRAGPFMAAPDTFAIEIRGVGGHAAFPHQVADPVVAAAQLVTTLQHVTSREIDPIQSAVVSVTTIHGGVADNVVPDRIDLRGTVRTFSVDMQTRVREAIARMAEMVAAAHRCTAAVEYEPGYRAVVNDEALADLVRRNVPAEALVDVPPMMGGEDFSAYQQVVAGCYFAVGGGGPGFYPHHHPKFRLDEAAVEAAVRTFVALTVDYLTQGPPRAGGTPATTS